MATRRETDSMGELEVPADRLYGAQTARAVQNFPVSGQGIGREMIRALAVVKRAAAAANRDLGLLDPGLAEAITEAADEVARGDLDDHFPVDVFQTGSGTSSNMNVNEVIANRAIQILGGEVGSRDPVHPNDHVNLGQSSNDVFPTAIHLAALSGLGEALFPALETLRWALIEKSRELDDAVIPGRTHLQDAAPVRLGQVLGGYARQLELAIDHLRDAAEHLRELPLGGTAVGTGLNAHPELGQRVAAELSRELGLELVEAVDHMEAQSSRDAAVRVSGALRALALALRKVADDLRAHASGPRLGLGELTLPAVQPGSSIMPGKANPVIAESLIQVAAQVVGNDAAIAAGAAESRFQLNTAMPLVARNLLESIRLLAGAVPLFTEKLVRGLDVDRQSLDARNERSLALATALVPLVGYDRAAAIAARAAAEGKTVREVAMGEAVAPTEVLDLLLDPRRQTGG